MTLGALAQGAQIVSVANQDEQGEQQHGRQQIRTLPGEQRQDAEHGDQ